MRVSRGRGGRGQPTVSVVIPCYNYGHFLDGVVGSVLGQSGVDARVIIVDDASPDGSADVAEALASKDSRIRLLRHERNQGHIQTYNDGLELADGEFVALLSADDLLAPGSLSRAASLMQHRPSVGLVYGVARSFSGEPPAPPERRVTWSVWPGQQWLSWSAYRGRNFILSPEVLMRTETLRKVGWYNPGLPHSGDLEYWLRAAAISDVARVNGPVHAYYRVHDANMHSTSFATMPVDLAHRRAAFDVLLSPDLTKAVPQATRFHELARRALALEALRLARAAGSLDGAGSRQSLVDFAVDTWPDVRTRRGFAAVQAADIPSALGWFKAPVRDLADRISNHAKWRLWNLAGVS